ncbi:MAG: tyrosine-type recombinase/integrase [Clostridia bacterium]|nr:tyrosine-type recombinase/integrase [Clostridia bacterium]
MEFNVVIQEFGFDCKIRKLSPKTIENYQKQLTYLQRYLADEHNTTLIEAVRSIHIKQFLAMMDEKGRKPQYINDLLKVFKTFFNYCEKEGHIKTSPAASIRNMKQPKVLIMTFSENEIRGLLNHFSGRDFISIRNKTIIALLFDTGMRLAEVINLRSEQIHDEYILVHGKGNKERLVPVSPFLAKQLLRYRTVRDSYFEDKRFPEGFVFVSNRGKQLTPEVIGMFLKQAAKEVGVNPQVRVSPHTCRHAFAHLQLKNGLDLYSLSRLMGHENVAITQRYLAGLQNTEIVKAAQKTGVLFNL